METIYLKVSKNAAFIQNDKLYCPKTLTACGDDFNWFICRLYLHCKKSSAKYNNK